jgi:hypothetical protein
VSAQPHSRQASQPPGPSKAPSKRPDMGGVFRQQAMEAYQRSRLGGQPRRHRAPPSPRWWAVIAPLTILAAAVSAGFVVTVPIIVPGSVVSADRHGVTVIVTPVRGDRPRPGPVEVWTGATGWRRATATPADPGTQVADRLRLQLPVGAPAVPATTGQPVRFRLGSRRLLVDFMR